MTPFVTPSLKHVVYISFIAESSLDPAQLRHVSISKLAPLKLMPNIIFIH